MERIGRKKSRIEEKVTAPLNKHLLIQTQCCSAAIMFIRLAQLGKTMHDQYGPEICHT